jgi:metal-sulfur cluster biosynthetic enzyme
MPVFTTAPPVGSRSAGEKSSEEKHAEVWERLSQVTDPELDQSVTEMQFVSALEIDAHDRVHIGFRLPTYWCAANFAFMMADDMHAAVSELPWVREVSVILDEHMYADKINSGIKDRQSFEQTFGDEADGNLDDVRRIFLLKAFQRRQEALLVHLRDGGQGSDRLVAMTLAELDSLDLDPDGARIRTRYLERRNVPGPMSANSLAFVTTTGAPLDIDGFTKYIKALRSVRVNAEFNGALCSGLLSARYEFDTTTPLRSQRKVAETPKQTN